MMFPSLYKFEVVFVVVTWHQFSYWIKGLFYEIFFKVFMKAIVFYVVVQFVVEVYYVLLLRNNKVSFELKLVLLNISEVYSVCLVSLLWIEALVWYLSGLLMIIIISSRTYKLGYSLHFCLHVLWFNPNITLFVFYIISILCKVVFEPQKITPYCDCDWKWVLVSSWRFCVLWHYSLCS
jgi:hypothetical protein